MKLHKPFIITPRLMPGVQVGGAFISIGQGPRNAEGRTEYGCFIDLPDGTSHEITDLRSGCQGGDTESGMASLLSFLSYAGESYRYNGEHSRLFPQPVTEWAYQYSDELSMLELEITEAEHALIEE